jgi:hypothetical protein
MRIHHACVSLQSLVRAGKFSVWYTVHLHLPAVPSSSLESHGNINAKHGSMRYTAHALTLWARSIGRAGGGCSQPQLQAGSQ